MLSVQSTAIPDVKILTSRRIKDERGFFSEVYSWHAFEEAGLCFKFVQDNHSLSSRPGTIRGLHFQAPPFAQGKLVRVVRGPHPPSDSTWRLRSRLRTGGSC
jgi:dTDP-4-dehydrorhamnose 3,5-epimerase